MDLSNGQWDLINEVKLGLGRKLGFWRERMGLINEVEMDIEGKIGSFTRETKKWRWVLKERLEISTWATRILLEFEEFRTRQDGHK